MFGPIVTAWRLISATTTAIFVGQAALTVWKHVSKYRDSCVKKEEFRLKFIEAYKKRHGKEPSAEELEVALEALGATSLEKWAGHFNNLCDAAQKRLEACIQGNWIEKLVAPKKTTTKVVEIQDEEQITESKFLDDLKKLDDRS